MRTRFLLLLAPLLGACAGPLPAHDPQRAWVDLYTQPANTLLAERLDGVVLDDGRYFQVPPGKHRLEVRFQYEVPGGGGPNGMNDMGQITCRVWLTYEHFVAGQRYRLELRPQLRSALALLTDASGQLVAKTDFQGTLDCSLP
ncbi:hypothetical protein [Pseudomonas panipatensis]|jgi:hypothetical protein|uniref:Lipoprotein n=1 Tax=Pseudomonas panipatensis TaxID=428992 RepID=A0A1G8LST6_9PSED|nr:hypothetical protein [Pseudomonas panipatensis]SDI58748.1 hypothetical protein SAMN05216272_11269 [Pseudomonas panipatensis]SMP46958.1 hypothetical protein SAMN06295951_10269 [Pseudomonas panipatensis]